MGDLFPEFDKLAEVLKSLDGKTVIHESKQIYGSLKDRQLSLKERLATNGETATVRQNLESAKAGMETPENTEMDDAMVSMWADDIIAKALGNIFKE